MSADWVGILLDVIVISLLVATIMVAYVLNKRLVLIREGREQLEGLIKGFSDATLRAESGVRGMRQTASETGEHLLKQIDRARALRDELQIMIETADSLCSRIEALGSRLGPQANPRTQPSMSATAPMGATAANGAAPANGGGAQPAGIPLSAARDASAVARTGASAQRVAQAAPDVAAKTAAPVVDTLSRAERELLQVIEKLR